MADREPSELTPQDENPMWDSDIEEREAKKKRMMFFGGSAAAVLLGFVGLYAALSWVAGGLTSDPDPAPTPGTATASAEVLGDAGAPPPAVDVADIGAAEDLEWYAIEAPLAYAERLYTSEAGTFYALSTIPGFVNTWPIPKAIYRSADGENWDMIALDDSISAASDMAGMGTSLYLIGTAPTNQNPIEKPEVMVSATSDEGETWTQTLLPTVATRPDGAAIQWTNVTTRIAAGADTVIATVQSRFHLDYGQMVPPEFFGNDYGYSPTADGVNVIDHMVMEQAYMKCENEMGSADGEQENISDECRALLFEGDESIGAVGFVTWEEMGLDDGNQPLFSELFASADGETFESIDSPFAPGSDIQNLYGTASGFIAVEWTQAARTVWTSADGREWQASDDLQQLGWISTVGEIDGRTVILGQSDNGAGAAWQNETGGWDIIEFNDVLGAAPGDGRWLSSGAIGPMGVVAVLQSWDERTERDFAEVVLGTGPDAWSTVPVDEVTGMVGGHSSWAAVGADRILVHYQVFNRGRGEPLNLQVMGVAAT